MPAALMNDRQFSISEFWKRLALLESGRQEGPYINSIFALISRY